MTKLLGNLTRVADLSSQDLDEAFDLMGRHYENVARRTFESDLAEKRWIIQLRSEASGELCGFSTQMLLDATVDDRPVKALFSGDTIIDPNYWGDPALMDVGGKLCLSLIDEFPNDELYWFLISAGYKTYRFLPVFFRQFYPRFDEPTPFLPATACSASDCAGPWRDRRRSSVRAHGSRLESWPRDFLARI